MVLLTKARSWLLDKQPLTLDEALWTLAISQEEYDELLRRRTMTRSEMVMDIAKQSDPSFKSFLVNAIKSYEEFREAHKTSWKSWPTSRPLKHLRRLIVGDISGKIGEIIVYLYIWYRLIQAQAQTGESAKVKS